MQQIIRPYVFGVVAGLGAAWLLWLVVLYFLFDFVGSLGFWPFGILTAASLAIGGYVSARQVRSARLSRYLIMGGAVGLTITLLIVIFTMRIDELAILLAFMLSGVAAAVIGALLGARRRLRA